MVIDQHRAWLAQHYRQFARNMRWGDCVDCPRDAGGDAYPEFCKHTDRYDHQLTSAQLAQQTQVRGVK